VDRVNQAFAATKTQFVAAVGSAFEKELAKLPGASVSISELITQIGAMF
jgi:hypothetical protein